MTKNIIPQLIVEHQSDHDNRFYLSVLEYHGEKYLVVVDNITQDGIGAYIIDLANQEGIDTNQLLGVITQWFYKGSHTYPLSFEFSKLQLSNVTNRIYRLFDIDNVTRLVGNDFTYRLSHDPKVKRRRVVKLPEGVEVRLSKSTLKMV